ncbi:DUF2812 domain-containing protein [Anaerobacillus alkaliphilus]|uniref:DUF2812 domain-containing protein n=1 Tax=Anaerobacillus alkaliphilus TaxID=1548597 RepID=A0A4Q0VUX8_9BACI|nr:DUF2812 domain-containing protein [Anaerobacillus alkaliphilus]RXJ02427.1 DUF2812 domain-containing protein [Anaerobacillus alkaliphilus]
MKFKVYKLFMNYEREEKWLNEMAAKGMHLVDFSFGRYVFEEGTPGEYIYRIELLENLPSSAESRAYIRWMEESGVDCVASYIRWVYFRKKASEGPFDLYSDIDSKISHYKKIAMFIGLIGGLNLAVALLNVFIGLSVGSGGYTYANIYISIVNWILVALLLPMFISHIRKIKTLEKEKLLFE